MSKHQGFSLILGIVGLMCVGVGFLTLQSGVALAYHSGAPDLPNDYRYWYHVGSKSITAEGAAAIGGLPAGITGDAFDAVFVNTVAENDLRNGTRPFRDGATFVAPFYKLEHPISGLDTSGDLLFTAVMQKDNEHFSDHNGWGFAAFAPDGTWLSDLGPACVSCHQSQSANDFVFTASLGERTVTTAPASDNGVFLPPDYRSMYWRGSKFISPDAATALGLPADIFGNTFDAVYLNWEGLKALSTETRPFPVGTLLVADFHAAQQPVGGVWAMGDVAFTAVMLKGAPGTGDDASTGDWKFEAFAPDGSALSSLRPACISCHAGKAANDYVFTGG